MARGTSEVYRPTKADIAFRDLCDDPAPNPYLKARLLHRVSHEYLAVMIHDNAGPTSAGFQAMLQAEAQRRGIDAAHRANLIAGAALLVAAGALAVSIFG